MERWRDELHYYSIPGGGVEENEAPDETAKREIYEELGLDVDIKHKLYELRTPEMNHHIYLCKYKGGEPTLQEDSPEAADNAEGLNRFAPAWVDISELATIPLHAWEPLRAQLVTDLKNGFSVETKTITVS